jgi:hypothetical protein
MSEAPHPNVGAFVSAFSKFAEGDLSGFSPDYTHLGFNIDGTPRVFVGLPAFVELMGKVATAFEVYETNVASIEPVGTELLLTVFDAYRRTHDGREYRGTFAGVFRVQDGILTRGSDMIESSGEAYWSSLGFE